MNEGDAVPYDRPRRQSVVTYLEMFAWAGTEVDWPPEFTLERLRDPSVAAYRALYNAVGLDHEWTERSRMPDDALRSWIVGDAIAIHVLRHRGELAGYSELRLDLPAEVELVYFGLVPTYRGQGLGKQFLDWTLNYAWDLRPQRVWLHTCDRDHLAAIPNYVRAGFRVFDTRLE